jgi:hypothetical protein
MGYVFITVLVYKPLNVILHSHINCLLPLSLYITHQLHVPLDELPNTQRYNPCTTLPLNKPLDVILYSHINCLLPLSLYTSHR